jgi:hypothetical protein
VAVLLTALLVLHAVLSPAVWHLGIDKADRLERSTVAMAASRSSISPARQHPHHLLAVHTCPGATVTTTSHRAAAGPAAGSPASVLILAVLPSATPPNPAHGPATGHDDNSRPRAILPHLLRC